MRESWPNRYRPHEKTFFLPSTSTLDLDPRPSTCYPRPSTKTYTLKPDSSASSRWMKTYSESRIELRNLQILKMLEKNQVSFCHRRSPVSRKAWTLPWKLQELKKYPRKTCGCGQPRGHLNRVLNERLSVNDGGDFCLLWLVILKSAWYSVGDTF